MTHLTSIPKIDRPFAITQGRRSHSGPPLMEETSLTQTSPVGGLSPELRTTLFYFTLMTTAGAANAFGGIWMEGRGLSASQIGVVSAAPVLVMLVLNMVAGRIADRASDWRQVIVAAAVLGGIFPIGLLWAADFWSILLFWTLTSIAFMTCVPVLDAAAMRLTARRGTDFGSMRAWATIGYLIAIIATGWLVTWAGQEAYMPFFVALALIRTVTSLFLPRFRAPDGEKPPTTGATRMLQVMKPWFLLPLFGFAIVLASHFILNAFQALLWERQGISLSTIGFLIAFGGLAETLLFFTYRKLDKRTSARVLLLIAGVVTVIRWTAMAFAPPVGWLIPLQALHGITYGLGFMACLTFIRSHTSEDIAAEAQGFFVMLQQGMSVLALVGFGGLVDDYGARAYFASALFAALGALCILVSIKIRPPLG